MNIIKLFDSFKIDNRTEEEVDTYMSRKEAFKKLGGLAKKTALASLPIAAFTAMPKMAFAKSSHVLAVLKFALTLERLEYQFYLMAQNSGVIKPEYRDVFDAITKHEMIHVNLLESVINSLGGTLEDVPSEFDYTAGGAFPSPFDNYQVFLALSQAFEDTGASAYKGAAPALIDNDNLLQTALKIHSVEARHASQVRRIRGVKGWITEADGIEGFGDTFRQATKPIYFNEDNTVQLGVNVAKVAELIPELVTNDAVKESFDEPLNMQQVLDIVSPFIVS